MLRYCVWLKLLETTKYSIICIFCCFVTCRCSSNFFIISLALSDMMVGIVYSLYNVSHMEIPAVQQAFGECMYIFFCSVFLFNWQIRKMRLLFHRSGNTIEHVFEVWETNFVQTWTLETYNTNTNCIRSHVDDNSSGVLYQKCCNRVEWWAMSDKIARFPCCKPWYMLME